jgi:hypothetical protein
MCFQEWWTYGSENEVTPILHVVYNFQSCRFPCEMRKTIHLKKTPFFLNRCVYCGYHKLYTSDSKLFSLLMWPYISDFVERFQAFILRLELQRWYLFSGIQPYCLRNYRVLCLFRIHTTVLWICGFNSCKGI